MDDTDLDLDELFLDALDAVVLAALERLGDDPDALNRSGVISVYRTVWTMFLCPR